jgi:acyl carrier protein
MINRALAQTVGTDSRRIDRSLSLAELGMDSLALMQLVRVLEVHTPVRLSDLRSMQTQSIERITSFLFERANETDRQTRSEAPVHLPSA